MIIRERAGFEDLPEATTMGIQVTVMWAPGLQISEFYVVSLNQISEGTGRKEWGGKCVIYKSTPQKEFPRATNSFNLGCKSQDIEKKNYCNFLQGWWYTAQAVLDWGQ